MAHFRIEMLPAQHGDCLWVEYGDPQRPHKLLIDGGTAGTCGEIQQRVRRLPAEQRHFELLVVTHVDQDHIAGVLQFLEDPHLDVTFDDIWFNGWGHLLPQSRFEDFGPVEGEKLTTRLLKPDLPWNHLFHQDSVSLRERGSLPPLAGGMQLILLSPGAQQLARLRPVWKRECEKGGLVPGHTPPEPAEEERPGFEAMGPQGVEALDVETLAQAPFKADDSEANGSSIAFLAEFDGRRVLFAGDAHADVLLDAIERLVGPGNRLRLDAFKLPHHGSKANVSRELLTKLDCSRYLFSTNGAYFKHPDREAVARVIQFGGPGPELIFNYDTPFTRIWDQERLMRRHGYSVSYPPGGYAIDL